MSESAVPADECRLCVAIGGYCGGACNGAWGWYRQPAVETRSEFVERCEQREAEEALL